MPPAEGWQDRGPTVEIDDSQYLTRAITRAQMELANAGITGELQLTVSYDDWRNILRELRFLSEPGDSIRLHTDSGPVTIRLERDGS